MASLDPDALQVKLKKKKICRFCLCQDYTKLTNIYMRDTRIKSSAPLPIQIMAIASIEVFSNDDMPSYVCSDCTDMFEFSYQFKQMCKKADNLLRQFPLTAKWPACLDKPVLLTNQLPKPPQGRTSLLVPKKILNSSINSTTTTAAVITSDNASKSERDVDCTITFLDKIENNDELSLDDIHQLVAAEDLSESDCTEMDNVPVIFVPKNETKKPKLLNKSSIRILNKEAEPENEPRLSLPKIKKDVDGKTEIVAEILNVGDAYEVEADPNNAAIIETNVFSCNYCERTFPLLQLRDIHMKNHFRDRKFQCDYCEKSFFSKYDLHRHSFIHSEEKPYKCSVCDQGFSRSSLLTRHEKTHTDVPKYICVHCERAFLLKEDMEKHVEKHKIKRPFVCKICNKRFAFKQGVERHEVVHSRQQPYTCQYCEESFSTATKLSRHLTAHAGNRPYPCKYCKKSYLLSHHLTRHLRSHKNVDDPVNAISFMCMRCNSNFGSRDELISHSTTHANEMNLACPLCKDVFDNMSDLTSHIQQHSQGEAFACEFCDLIFITAEKLQSHSDLDHITEIEAYHIDDNARANKLMEDSKSKLNVSDTADEKLQKTVNEFLDDESSPFEGNNSETSLMKDIKEEKETDYPKVVNQIVIESQHEEDSSILIPLKQRMLDAGAKQAAVQSKKPQQVAESPILRRKIPVTRASSQPTIQSLLKLPENVKTSSKTSLSKKPPIKTSPPTKISLTKSTSSKTPPFKTPLSKTPPSQAAVSKKVMLTTSLPAPKLIKLENERPVAASSSATSINDDTLKTKIGPKNIKVQRITVTKAQAAAMVKEGRIKIEDGKIILKK